MNKNEKISVILVDDSDVYRILLFKVLSQEKDLEVISLARSGLLAIPRVRHYKPDIVLLDIEMPGMDGLQALEIISKESPETNVIMFCSESHESARHTMKALELGAKDFIIKPKGTSKEAIEDYIKAKLVTKIRAIAGNKTSEKDFIERREVRQFTKKGKYEVCAIGISTGGPDALRKLIPLIPENIDGSILIVQHMPAFFTKQLAESLNTISEVKVVEGEDGAIIKKGTVYIAPGGKHMGVKRNSALENCIVILDEPPEESCKPSSNVLFRSIAQVFGQNAIGILMTGMGKDGYSGFLEMKQKGSYLLAQTEESCLVFGMPMLPIKEKLVSETHNIHGLGEAIIRLLGTV